MKAKDLRERTTEDLNVLRATYKQELFSFKMKYFTNQLEDTSLIRKSRRDLARIEIILHERTAADAKPAGNSESVKGSDS